MSMSLFASMLLAGIDATSVVFALPAVTQDLHCNLLGAYCICISAQAAAFVSRPIASSFSARAGQRGLVLVLALAAALGAVVMDRSTCLGWFLAGRTMQGIGAGGQVALAIEAYATLTPAAAWSCFDASIALLVAGTYGGPLLGEVVATYGGWRYVFRLNTIANLFLLLSKYLNAQS